MANSNVGSASPSSRFIPDTIPSAGRDEDLHHRIRRFLARCDVPLSSDVEINVHGGHVVLRGRVKTTDQHRICVGATRRVAGVLKVIDELATGS